MLKVYEHEQVVCIEGILEETRSRVFLFLVDGTLIDTGAEKMQDDLKKELAKLSFDQVVLTHHHEDHTGNAAWIQQHYPVPFYIHPIGQEITDKDGVYPDYRQLTWGNRDAFRTQALGDRINSRTFEWEVIHTPGHADDHVALFHPESGRLFTGDLFVTPKSRVVMKGESISRIKTSLRKLLTLPFKSVFCSHAGYLENGRALLEEKLNYLESLQEKILQLYKDGETPSDIHLQLFPKTYPIVRFSNGEWDSLHIVTSTIADYDEKKNRHLRPRANVLGILRKGQSVLLEQQFARHSSGKGPFYRPIGGTIELGEPSAKTVEREFKEEIGADIKIVQYVDVIENIYTLKNQVFHEISLVYEVEFDQQALYDQDVFDVFEDGKMTKAKWVSLEELDQHDTVLYPTGLLDLLTKLPSPVANKL
ncbi:hypothetical protein GPDM_05226 [Planococcus donghaensis MPA1U2]|uniref:Nudix hydrolase domain-containing protein n=1 Tax=Planococcus donghaensis MPA1U2 TaxID=933115 RepID=E7RF03_9BACL|nr:MBL fold metallo-hydrolase [Planococcus donghaensis]EGA90402.1 hypothetical protein GPDM_05226 [Planococcus donghaensis MPA1U2]